jgi:hypothetical protein
MAIVLNGTTGITAPDIDVTAQASDITTTGDITAVDATLSGGVYLGGTGSANYLDDYEEGTWTPQVNGWTSVTYSINTGNYTKIGNQVTAYFYIQFSGTSLGITAEVTGLPFTPSMSGAGGTMTFCSAPLDETKGINLYTNSTLTTIRLYNDGDNGNLIRSNSNSVNHYMIGLVTYQTS